MSKRSLQKRFSELQQLLLEADEARDMIDKFNQLDKTDKIYLDLFAAHDHSKRQRTDVEKDVQEEIDELVEEWTTEQDTLETRITQLRDELYEGGYDIDSWIVAHHIRPELAKAQDDPESCDLRRNTDAYLETVRPVKVTVGNETILRPLGSRGHISTVDDRAELAVVDELEEVDDKDEVTNEVPPDLLRVFDDSGDVLKLLQDEEHEEEDEPLAVVSSGAKWHGNFRFSPQQVKTLKDYQIACQKFVLDRICDDTGALVAHCMGLGKSLTVLSTLETLRTCQNVHAIVSCPASMILPWAHEVNKWTDKGLIQLSAFPVVGGDKFEREHRLWTHSGGVLIVSHDMLKKIVRDTKTVTRDMVLVFDEAHELRSPQTQLYKAVESCPTKRRILMTGTPLQNHLKEYYAMIQLVAEDLLGTSSGEFNKLYANDIERGMLKESTPEQIRKSERTVQKLRWRVEGVMHDESVARLRELLPMKREFRVAHAVSDFAPSTNKVIEERHELHTHALPEKVSLVLLLIDAIRNTSPTDRIVVFSPYIDVLSTCATQRSGFTLNGTMSLTARESAIDSFRKSAQGVFYATTGAGGVGLDLSCANHVIVVDASWNPAVDAQAISRCWRIGQKKETIVYRLTARQTLEDRMLRMQVLKTSLAMRVMDDQDITRFYTKEDLTRLGDDVEDDLELDEDTIDAIAPALAQAMRDASHASLDAEIGVYSHDANFKNDDAHLSEDEKALAKNELTEILVDNARELTLPDGSTETVLPGCTHFLGASYSDRLVPPYKPLSVSVDADELELLGVARAAWIPTVRFAVGMPLHLRLGPSFPSSNEDMNIEICFRSDGKRRWAACMTVAAHAMTHNAKLYHAVDTDLVAGAYVFKARFTDGKKFSDWSEESEPVVVE